MNKKYTKEEILFLKENYGILSYKEIALKFNRTHQAIKGLANRVLKNNLGERGKNKFSRTICKYSCNENFFSEINDNSSYWAGFIAADGCIIEKKGNYQKCLRIMLAIKDYDHLKNFVEDIKFNGVIAKIKIKYKYKGIFSLKEQCYIDIRSNKICNDLFKIYNISPRKSLIYSLPENINFNFLYFLKGYVDGDGSIEKPIIGKQWSARVSILGTYSFLKRTMEILSDRILFSEKALRKKNNIYCLIITSQESIKLLKILSSLSGICLNRKWENINKWCQEYKDPRILFRDKEINDILERLNNGEKQHEIAKFYNVHQVTISNIKLGRYCLQNIFKETGVIDIEEVESLNEEN